MNNPTAAPRADVDLLDVPLVERSPAALVNIIQRACAVAVENRQIIGGLVDCLRTAESLLAEGKTADARDTMLELIQVYDEEVLQ